MKALGLGLGAFGFHDAWVEVGESGPVCEFGAVCLLVVATNPGGCTSVEPKLNRNSVVPPRRSAVSGTTSLPSGPK